MYMYLNARLGLGKFLEQQVALLCEAQAGRFLLVPLAQHGAQRSIGGLEVGEAVEQRLTLSAHAGHVVLRQALLL